MPDVDAYPAGVPCWVETLQPDLAAAMRFYAGVFGWTMLADDEEGPTYVVATLRGREVAGIASAAEVGADDAVGWLTQVRVDDLDAALSQAVGAGATDVVGPVDAGPAGHLAILTDPGRRPAGSLGGDRPGGSRGRERAQRVGDERLADPGPRSLPSLLRGGVRLGRRRDGTRRPVPAAGVRRWHRAPAGTPSTVAVGFPAADSAAVGWHVDFWSDDVAGWRVGWAISVAASSRDRTRRTASCASWSATRPERRSRSASSCSEHRHGAQVPGSASSVREEHGAMEAAVSLFWIALVAVASPLLSALVPRRLVPETVLLLAFGVVIGPHVLGIATMGEAVEAFRELGLGMLFLLAGYEIELKELTGRGGRRALVTWVCCFLLALGFVGLLGFRAW